MKKIMSEYGGVVVVVIAIVALITMITVMTNEMGVLNSSIKTLVQQLSDKTNNMIEDSAGGAGGGNAGGDNTGGSTGTDTSVMTANWAALVEASEDGSYVTKYPVGTEVTLELQDGSTAVFVVVAHNQDTLADGSGTANMTLISQDLLGAYKMNDTNTNAGGWEASGMRAYLQTNPYIPEEAMSHIKTVSKTSFDHDTLAAQTTSDQLWIPSYTEVGATNTIINGAEGGPAYSCFTDNASRIKYNNGSAAAWWLRSALDGGAFSFCRVSSSGGDSISFNASISGGVVLGFCI